MTYYRLALGIFLIGNVAVFTLFMRNNGYPWDAFLIFVGVLYVNAPVVVSFLTAQKIDEALKGHWLNWMNIAIPTLVCGSGLLAYVNLALEPGAHPAIFNFGATLVSVAWLLLLSLMLNIYVFVRDR